MQELPEKRYYNIGEVAKAFGLKTSTIRFWEQNFEVLKPKKNAKGTRKFTPADIEYLKRIFHLVKERGFTIDGAKKQLKLEKSNQLSTLDVIQKLEHVKEELLKIKSQL